MKCERVIGDPTDSVRFSQTNQLAIRTHLTQPPHSIILDARSHVHLYEAGGVAMHSQASSHAVPPRNGHHLTLEEILDNAVFGEDIHSAPTKLVSLENTLSGSACDSRPSLRSSADGSYRALSPSPLLPSRLYRLFPPRSGLPAGGDRPHLRLHAQQRYHHALRRRAHVGSGGQDWLEPRGAVQAFRHRFALLVQGSRRACWLGPRRSSQVHCAFRSPFLRNSVVN